MSDFPKNKPGIPRWLVLAALGLLLIVAQRLAKNIVYTVFAVGLLLAGISGAYGWWRQRSPERDDLVTLIGSVALFVVGLWIFRNPDAFDKVINVIIGLVLIVAGLYWLNLSRPARDTLMTALSCVSIVLGLIVAFSHAATTWLVTAEGISLLYSGVTGLIGEKLLR